MAKRCDFSVKGEQCRREHGHGGYHDGAWLGLLPQTDAPIDWTRVFVNTVTLFGALSLGAMLGRIILLVASHLH